MAAWFCFLFYDDAARLGPVQLWRDPDDVSPCRPNQSVNQYYFTVSPIVDQRAGQLSLRRVGMTKTERNRTKT